MFIFAERIILLSFSPFFFVRKDDILYLIGYIFMFFT